jgi:hypothetical protein
MKTGHPWMERWRVSGWRAIVLLIIGGVLGASLLTPAAAHISDSFTHLWNTHIKPKADHRYLLRPTGTQQSWVAGSSWIDEDGGSVLLYGQDSWCRDNGGSGYLTQQVHLPNGAKIIKYRAGYKDDGGSGGSNGGVYLTREALNGGTGTYGDLDFVNLPDASGWTYVDQTLASPVTVNNHKYAYIFIYSLSGSAGACTAGVYYKAPPAPTTGQPLAVDTQVGNLSNP